MKLSLWGWTIELVKEETKKDLIEELYKFHNPPQQGVVELPGEVIPGYETFEGELQQEEDSVEEREWREEQNWLNKRKQKDGTI